MTTTTSPTTNTSTTMDNEAFTAASLTAARRRASLKFIFSPNNTRPQPSTTNKIILDYLLYLSIQSRLKQSQLEVLELSTPLLQEKDQDAIQLRKERWLTTAKKAEQDKNAVESIVTGKKKRYILLLFKKMKRTNIDKVKKKKRMWMIYQSLPLFIIILVILFYIYYFIKVSYQAIEIKNLLFKWIDNLNSDYIYVN